MSHRIKFVHTNLIAKDWKKLSQFYIDVFECKPVYPEKDLSGEWIDRITSIDDVRIRGIHLALPGYEEGPTLEIFEYHPDSPRTYKNQINNQGFGHIAFHVESVEDTLDRLIKHGGRPCGELIRKEYKGTGLLTVVYAEDIEGNFVEIQNWQ